MTFTSNEKIIEKEKKTNMEFLSVSYIALTFILFVCITSSKLMFLGEISGE